MSLPVHFCWTRFGTEAGEPTDEILGRKELERVRNGGIFLWGIGNALGPSMRRLLELEDEPEVVFSPIRSSPQRDDVEPNQIAIWTTARALDGTVYSLPTASKVTSRATSRVKHYALVCGSAEPLRIDPSGETIEFSNLRNVVTDRPVGASQVTAIVRRATRCISSMRACYVAAIRARLIYPFFVELSGRVLAPA